MDEIHSSLLAGSSQTMPPTASLQIDGVVRGQVVWLTLNGKPVEACAGENIASVMWQAGLRTCRVTRQSAQPRGYYCGMGVCFECVVNVVGTGDVRSCRTPVAQDMQIRTQLV